MITDPMKHRLAPGLLIASLVAVALIGCEDRRLAMEAANLGNLRLTLYALGCRAPSGFPDDLAALAIVEGDCPGVDWIARAQREGTGLRYAGYLWHYRPTGRRRSGSRERFEGYEIQAISRPVRPDGCPRCRSFWVNQNGVVRWALGRPAGPGDPELHLE